MLDREDRRPPFRAAPFVLLLLGLAAATAVAWFLARGQARPEAKPNEPTDGELLAPIARRPNPVTGEETAPFSGFALQVDTEPPGALVTVGGVAKGESPALAGLDCLAGEEIEIAIEKSGYAPARRTTRCRSDTLVRLSVALEPVRP